MFRRTIPLLALTLVLVASASAQRRAGRETLQEFRQGWDRRDLRQDILFRGEFGLDEAGVRCATRPVRLGEAELVDRIAAATPPAVDVPAPTRKKTTIPVVFHVVRTKNGKFNVSNQKIDAQMEVLNEAFAKRGFQFELADIIRYNHKFGRKCANGQVESDFKQQHAVDPMTTLNVYTCRPSGGFLGWAWFPWDYPEGHTMHGVVMLYSTVPKGGAAPYDEGDTLTHEVGHYLGLYHTFQGGCGGSGDRVDDTPAQSQPTYGCPAVKDTCPAQDGDDPIDNFMDYTDDACMLRFTKGQKARMKEQVAAYRPTLRPS